MKDKTRKKVAGQLPKERRKLRNTRRPGIHDVFTNIYFAHSMVKHNHHAYDSMSSIPISPRHRAAYPYLHWTRHLIGAISHSSRLQLQLQTRSPCRSLSLLANDNPKGAKPSGREQLQDKAYNNRTLRRHDFPNKAKSSDPSSDRWELTIGIEIHAQLNTERKLFSSARTSINDEPNSHVSVFDLAFPGSQPLFQKATLVPALRAALALNCDIQYRSQFDRKHYFYQDQPAGYQITQYYEPFAKNGLITINDHDGIAPEDGASIQVGIKQIQLEQDTAKTITQFPSTILLDFNRVSHPLIEIITLPHIHHPQTAAACVRKIQAILQAVNSVTTGMEMGGLRADVNVSVQPRFPTEGKVESHTYAGVTGLGQRTEIKNLSSFKAVEDAIIAERNRQIALIESGGAVQGETRGWTLGSTETKKLRGKEGEVDYRYLPDPDLSPLIIGPDLVKHISESLPMLPDESIKELVDVVGLTVKDAKTLVSLDGGKRLDYYDEVLDDLGCSIDKIKHVLADTDLMDKANSRSAAQLRKYAKTAANWVLHELGGLLSTAYIPFSENNVSSTAMASIVRTLLEGRITGTTAKELLAIIFEGDSRDVEIIIQEENMGFQSLPREVYMEMAQGLIGENAEIVHQIQSKGKHGKIQWLVGQMMRQGKGKMEAGKAEAILKEILGVGTNKVDP